MRLKRLALPVFIALTHARTPLFGISAQRTTEAGIVRTDRKFTQQRVRLKRHESSVLLPYWHSNLLISLELLYILYHFNGI